MRTDKRNAKRKKVVVMYAPSNSELLITQKDLAEESFLKLQAAQAIRALRQKRDRIRQALAAGAAVEPGLRSAELAVRRPLVIR